MAAPLPEATDADLVRRAQLGGEGAAHAEEQLCVRLLPRIRVYLARHLARDFDIEGLSHDALIVVLEGLRSGKLEDPERVGAYALGVCKNKVRERLRHRRRRDRALERETLDRFAEVPIPRVMLGRLEECLHMLRERERVLLRVTFCEGRSAVEAGAHLEITPENARVLRHRTIDRLRRCLRVGKYEAEQR
jgi:RNA polymerase sigma-70 factor (ECF subfamily)